MIHRNKDGELRTMVVGSAVLVVIILIVMLVLSWILSRGVEDNPTQAPATSSQDTGNMQDKNPLPEVNPGVTGGSSAGGTGNSNDPSISTPSPAGGVDTNGNQAQ